MTMLFGHLNASLNLTPSVVLGNHGGRTRRETSRILLFAEFLMAKAMRAALKVYLIPSNCPTSIGYASVVVLLLPFS